MGLATLNGKHVTDARLTIPAWGVSYHECSVDGEVTFSGAVTLAVADLTIVGTVLNGGPAAGRSFYRIVAGAGGWAKTLPKKSYANDAGVKLATALGDAAAAVGETLDQTTVDQTVRLGPGFVRPEGPARLLLEQLAPNAWYVGEDGKTRLGQRPASVLPAKVARTSQLDKARGTVTLASDAIAGILPGVQVDGLEAIDVEHTVDDKGGLRSQIWGRQGTGNSRRLAAYKALIEQLDPNRKFRSLWEYRVVTQSGERLNLQPVRVSTGMPDLQRVYVRPGAPGVKAQHALGSRVLVGFVDESPGRPVVLAFEDAEGGGFVPISLSLAGGGPAVGRVGDSVRVTIDSTVAGQIIAPSGSAGGPCSVTAPVNVTGTITSGSPKVTSG